MRTWKLPATWQMWGTLHIDAETLEEAKEIALRPETSLPHDREYLDDSFKLEDDQILKEANEPKE